MKKQTTLKPPFQEQPVFDEGELLRLLFYSAGALSGSFRRYPGYGRDYHVSPREGFIRSSFQHAFGAKRSKRCLMKIVKKVGNFVEQWA